MGALKIVSDTHLGHKAICKYRTQFTSEEEHNETIFDNIVSNINKRDTLYFLGDIAFNHYWLDKIKSIRCAHKLLVVGNHCISMDTEVLTDIGWVLANKITGDEYIGSVCLATGELSYSKPLKTFISSDQKLISIKGTYKDELVSEGHSVIYNKERVCVSSLTAKVKTENFFFNFLPNQGKCKWTGDEVELITWIVCGGTLVQDKICKTKKRVQFKLSKIEKIKGLEELLGRMGIGYTKRAATLSTFNKLQPYYICIYGNFARKIFEWFPEGKFFPKNFQDLNMVGKDSLLKSLIATNAYKDYNRVDLVSVVKEDLEVLQILFLKYGYPTALRGGIRNKMGFPNGKIQYKLSIHLELGFRSRLTNISPTEIYGDVLGITMKEGTILTRRDGKPSITGNCTERDITMKDLVGAYDKVVGLMSKRNMWWTHCPIHPQEIRGRDFVIHGHLHSKVVPDERYINVCMEHTDYKPITIEEALSQGYRDKLKQHWRIEI